jgi:exosortase A
LNGQAVGKVDASKLTSLVFCIVLILATWTLVFWQGISTAIDIWLISEIFNHCLFVLPGSAYLMYLKRHEISISQFKPNYFVSILCAGSLTLYAIGLAGDVQLFMHLATFTFLPFCIWAFVGNQIASKILFPLVFILFCIPIGEELVPSLQEITADLSVAMLNLTGIPIYRSGLYIEIPQGRFLVAEACSGISFFIASVVIGSLYSYLNIRSARRRILFMTIAILFPVIANAIRVFGIILTGYLTDMEHAVGADHLIYGWVFFALVIICLLGIGELVREKQFTAIEPSETPNAGELKIKTCYQSSISITGLMLFFFIWFKIIDVQVNEPSDGTNLAESSIQQEVAIGFRSVWEPKFIEPYQDLLYTASLNNKPVDVYVAWYPSGHGELISSLNRLYTEKAWSLESTQAYQLENLGKMSIATIVNPRSKRLLTSWYVIDGKVFTDNRMAKLYEIYQIMLGNHIGSGLIALSQETENVTLVEDTEFFRDVVKNNLDKFSQHFVFE